MRLPLRPVHVGLCFLATSALLLSGACRPTFLPSDDCYRGLGVGEIVELDLIERYTRTGRFLYWDMGLDRAVSCDGADGLGPGVRLRIRLVNRGTAEDECFSYWGELVDTLPGVSARPQPLNGPGVLLGTANGYESASCPSTFWRLFAIRHPDLDDDPFDEPADPGRWPPVILRREINGCCLDEFVATIRHDEPSDAGTDAR